MGKFIIFLLKKKECKAIGVIFTVNEGNMEGSRALCRTVSHIYGDLCTAEVFSQEIEQQMYASKFSIWICS